MARRHDEPLEVAAGPGPGIRGATGTAGTAVEEGPRSFVWRGRRYAVCAVLDSWQERRAWWREVGEHPGGAPDTERRVWRVEARPPAGTVGVFDLGRDDDHWLLLRAHD
ncbi:hypothetical protein KC207_07360 [Phycicoccus sp. BSK3Z-2]|uniref:DUF6504 domain-containing protein n=1 Tax=Phycicoccus avicenniae TaxID=2828860 RepID=A0A941I0C3_9MICO|nr:DUF6504 family protein [Phycicoccus avicenniae]MBR7743106.1 hypothetical protein [Phycicoccus avicenniae]